MQPSAKLILATTCATVLLASSIQFSSAKSSSQEYIANETQSVMDRRSQTALEITKNCNAFTKRAEQLIAQANDASARAKRLNGSAKTFGTTFAPKIRPLKGARLAEARRMYQSDLSQFASHVSEYREHNADVRKAFGQCAASRAAYEKNKNSYALHCKEFHMEDLPPPHVCVTMEQAVSNSDSAAGRLKSSVKRLVDSQIELMKTESRLNAAIANSTAVDLDVRKQHEMNLKEQDLAVEFAKLEEEYKQLDVEKRTLTASGVKSAATTVTARIRKK